jgi:hypothetical protein
MRALLLAPLALLAMPLLAPAALAMEAPSLCPPGSVAGLASYCVTTETGPWCYAVGVQAHLVVVGAGAQTDPVCFICACKPIDGIEL